MRDRDVGRVSGWMDRWVDGSMGEWAKGGKKSTNAEKSCKYSLLAKRNRKRVLTLSISAHLAKTQWVHGIAHILKKVVLQS